MLIIYDKLLPIKLTLPVHVVLGPWLVVELGVSNGCALPWAISRQSEHDWLLPLSGDFLFCENKSMLSLSERNFIRQGIVGNVRSDGRSRDQTRRKLETADTLSHTPGSASVVIDMTSVLVAIQARVSPPNDVLHPRHGTINITVDLYLGRPYSLCYCF